MPIAHGVGSYKKSVFGLLIKTSRCLLIRPHEV